jgi:SOS-response transcriptional repressor LexA
MLDIDWFKTRKRELRVTDADLGDAIGRDRSIANKLVTGKLPFDIKYVQGFAATLQVSREEILRKVGALDPSADIPQGSNAQVMKLEGASLEEARENLPVFGTAMGAPREIEGEAIEQTTLNKGEIVEYMKRPVILNGKADAYALYVQGSSMHPVLPDGEMVAVTPTRSLGAGDNVVVYLRPTNPEDDDGMTARAVLVKELVRRTASHVILRQYQPAMDFRVEMTEIIRIDRVLTRKEMLS